MRWINLNAVFNEDSRPRLLTPAEIEYIVQSVPLAPSADRESALLSRDQIMADFRLILSMEEFTPRKIEALVQRIVAAHNSSLVTPGTPVGFAAGESVGAATTQFTLNTFHSSGSASSALYTINSLKDIITATMNPKMQRCTVHYRNKNMSYVDVLNSRSYIVGSVVSDFVTRYEIARLDTLPQYWWNEQGFDFYEKTPVNAVKIMRLHLNLAEMYKHRVSTRDIAAALENEITYKVEKKKEEEEGEETKKSSSKKEKDAKAERTVVALHGSTTEAIIDLYQTAEGKNKYRTKLGAAFDDGFVEQSFFETIVRLELPNIKVKGVSGLKNLVPIIIPVWSLIGSENRGEGPGVWYLNYDESVMIMNGINAGNISRLAQVLGMTVISDKEPKRMTIRMPDDDKFRYRSARNDYCLLVDGTYYRYVKDLIEDPEAGYIHSLPTDSVTAEGTGFKLKIEKDKFETLTAAEVFIRNGAYYRVIPDADVYFTEEESFVRVPSSVKVTELGPSDFVRAKISNEKLMRQQRVKDIIDEYLEQTKDLDAEQRRIILSQPVTLPPSPLLDAAQFVIAQVEGSNLRDLLALPQIDKQRTTCDNVHVLAETFGIESTRAFIIRAMTNTIGSSSQVHPANVFLIAEFIVSRGYPRGATFAGIARQPGGHLSLASLQKAGAVFTKSALQGKEEDIRGVSASIAVGARFALGDGSFDIGQDVVIQGKNVTLINEDLFDLSQLRESKPKVSGAQLARALDEINLAQTRAAFDHKEEEDEASLLNIYNFPVQDVSARVAIEQVVFGAAVAQANPAPSDRLDPRAFVLPTLSSGLVSPVTDEVLDLQEPLPVEFIDMIKRFQTI